MTALEVERYTVSFCATAAFVEACGHYWLDQAKELREKLLRNAVQYGRDFVRLQMARERIQA